MKMHVLWAAICSLLLFAGCNNDQADGRKIYDGVADVKISLINRQLPTTKAPAGKEDGTDDENRITSLEFYVFDATGNTLDPEVGRVDAATPGHGYLRLTTSDLTNTIRVSAGTGKKFVVAANMNLGAPTAANDTYDKLIAMLSTGEFKATAGANDHNARTIPAAGLEMSGAGTADVIAESPDNLIYVTITRLVSKINTPTIASDVPVQLADQQQIDKVWGANSGVTPASEVTFTFKGYAVINAVAKSTVLFSGNAAGNYIDPANTPWNTWTAKPFLHSTFDATGAYTNNYSGMQGTSWFLDGTTDGTKCVYLYESKPTATVLNGIEGYDPETVCAYIIKGTLSTAGQNDATRYWRVDLTQTDSFHIMRNCVYKVTVDQITTPGFGTPQEAEEQPIVPAPGQTFADFVVSVAQWDINAYTTHM